MIHRILVVDDDDDVRRLASIALSRVGGHEVTSVSSGAECLAALTGELPDAIVLDVMMPGMDGPTTLHALQDDPTARDIPVVLPRAHDCITLFLGARERYAEQMEGPATYWYVADQLERNDGYKAGIGGLAPFSRQPVCQQCKQGLPGIRLGEIVIHPGGNTSLAVALHGVRRQGNDR